MTWPSVCPLLQRSVSPQAHLAHRRRKDGKRSPAEVLGWVRGVWCDGAELDRLFRLRSERVFDRHGYLRFRRWRVYGERGLAGRRGAVWLSGEALTVAYGEEALGPYPPPVAAALLAGPRRRRLAPGHAAPSLRGAAAPGHVRRSATAVALTARRGRVRHRCDRYVYPLL